MCGMPVNVCLPLFGNPARELGEGAALRGRDLRELGQNLHQRLEKAADMLEKLQAAGWTARVAEFDVMLTRADVQTRESAERLLREADVELEQLIILEEVEEEEVDST